ncbi:MAG: TonB-dependent receptor [Thermoanaerobaculia bacterium]
MNGTIRRWTLALATLMLATGAWAQTDVTTTRASGTITDEQGGALPGATVTIRNDETGLTASAVSDERGFYRLLNLPSGTYTLTVELEGFATAEKAGVRLILGSTPTLDVKMELSAIAETISVTSEAPEVEVTNTAATTTITTEQIKNIPLSQRDFRNLVLLTPSTRFDSERGNLSISGQRGINTNVTVDGVDFNNAFFGGTVGGAEGRAPLSISQESIKEFSVITNGASVEFGRSGGGFVNVVTKSGTNNLHGSLFYYNQPQSLISDFANGVEPADQEKDQFGGSLGGAILKDRLFYFVSYDEQTRSETVPIDARTLDSAVFARYPQLTSSPTYAQTQDGDVLFGRLDFQISDTQRVMVRANFTDYTGENGTSNSTSRADTYNGIEGLDTEAYVGSWSGQFGSNLLNDFNVNYITEDTPREDKGLDLPGLRVTGLGDYGEVDFLPIVSTTERKAVGDTVTWLTGPHVWKFGGEYNDTSIDQIFKGNWRGVFRFNNRADFLAGKWASYNQFGGLGGLTADEGGRANFGQKETALFVQDQWFLRSNLTFSFGLRAESLDNPDDPILNPNDVNADGSYRFSGKVPDASISDQLSPRIGLSWSPGEDGKTALRFSAGRYWSRTPAILLAQLFTSNGVRGTQYQINAPNVGGQLQAPTDPLSPGWGADFTVQGTERIDFTQVPNPRQPGVFAIDPDFENPYTDRMTLNAEREILPFTVVGVDLTYAKGKQLQRLTDINLQYDGTLSANGLPHYSRTRPNSYYGRVTTSLSDAESEYKGVTVLLRRRMHNDFQYYASLTWSRDEDNDSNERNFAGIQAEDINNLDLNYGKSNRDQAWKGIVNGLWRTPLWGIELSGSIRYSTGSPWTISAGSDLNGDTNNVDRPTINGVHVERNGERQPDFKSLDLRLGKGFGVGLGEVTVFVECFNCTDEANRFIPGNNMSWGSATGASPVSSNFGAETGVGTPRTIQLGARWDF